MGVDQRKPPPAAEVMISQEPRYPGQNPSLRERGDLDWIVDKRNGVTRNLICARTFRIVRSSANKVRRAEREKPSDAMQPPLSSGNQRPSVHLQSSDEQKSISILEHDDLDITGPRGRSAIMLGEAFFRHLFDTTIEAVPPSSRSQPPEAMYPRQSPSVQLPYQILDLPSVWGDARRWEGLSLHCGRISLETWR
ncbi:hypothetical protein BO94DRAFT_125302 [Aspergillus sclerotioniger CBS 115572]|uniref:Uncharacterized protein n=1 Tax=Aspergillus sclerotioniger CBS 115572 TaxID=1450535 RepID=A0A317XEQ5_9EURO|nr:hypothetical protein BO94DRAFT_125302 [Aspergillus sclerotioniger CBS 115572]PWY95448.1 hypothetical protein BO94DRAFT_125302 [Aspergillus sclerotioniger CBS 115572]